MIAEDGTQLGVLSTNEARWKAREAGLGRRWGSLSAGLGYLWVLLASSGVSWAVFGSSLGLLGAPLGSPLDRLGRAWAEVGLSWTSQGSSWASFPRNVHLASTKPPLWDARLANLVPVAAPGRW